MLTTFGCWSEAAAWASWRNRLRRSSCRAMDSFMTLIATVRSRTESEARYTTPIAPSPTSSMMWYLPMSGRAAWVMGMPKYAVGTGRLTRISFNGPESAIRVSGGLLPGSPLALQLHVYDSINEGREFLIAEMNAGVAEPARDVDADRFVPGLPLLIRVAENLAPDPGPRRVRRHDRRGRCTVNVVPRSSDDSTSIRPL